MILKNMRIRRRNLPESSQDKAYIQDAPSEKEVQIFKSDMISEVRKIQEEDVLT